MKLSLLTQKRICNECLVCLDDVTVADSEDKVATPELHLTGKEYNLMNLAH